MTAPVKRRLRCKPRVVENRVKGIERLSKAGNKIFISAFMNAVKSPCVDVRAAGVGALGKKWTWKPGRIGYLLRMMKDSSYKVRKAAATALGELGDKSVVPHLTTILKKEVARVRRNTRLDNNNAFYFREALIQALYKLRSLDAIPVLLYALLDPENEIRLNAGSIIGILYSRSRPSKQILSKLVQLLTTYAADGAAAAISRMPTIVRLQIVDKILPLLDHKNDSFCINAIRALDGLKDHRIMDRIVPLLDDKYYYARSTAVEVLGRTRDKRYLPAIIKKLADPHRDVRSLAISQLWLLGGIKAHKALITHREKESEDCQKLSSIKLAIALNAAADLLVNPALSSLSSYTMRFDRFTLESYLYCKISPD